MRPLLVLLALFQQQPAPRYDVVITGGMVIDGTGAPAYRADLGVRGDRIVTISRTPLSAGSAARVIDARNRVVAPGFIDLHAHNEAILTMPDAESRVRQGVTTALGGRTAVGPIPSASTWPGSKSCRSGSMPRGWSASAPSGSRSWGRATAPLTRVSSPG